MSALEPRTSEPKKLPGIFISYRRSDTPDAVGRIYDRLVAEFGKARVFKDVDSIPLGQDFRSHLNDIVGGCAAVLAIIGPRWVDTRNPSGQRRLEDPDDFVRIELEAALARSVPVVPVLVGHAPMPGTTELPASLASMAFRQSIEVRPDPDFHNDATRLVTALRAIIDPDAPVPTPSAVPNLRESGLRWVWPLAFAVAALAAATLAVPALRYLRQTPLPETRTEISIPTEAGPDGGVALSPDGKQIAYVVTKAKVSHIWIRPLIGTVGRPLPGTEGGTRPFWSPDSHSIGFFTSTTMKRIDLDASAPLTLAPVNYGGGGTWNSNDVILFSQGLGAALARISATGGEPIEVTQLAGNALSHSTPLFLPDGRRFLFVSTGGSASGVYQGSLEGGAPTRLTSIIGEIAYHPAGWLLAWSSLRGVLTAQRLDADKAALVGAPVPVTETGFGFVTTSETGLIAYWKRPQSGAKRRLAWRDRSGEESGTVGEPNETDSSPRVSSDGRRVVVARRERGNSDIWLLEGARASRATFDAVNSFPILSPDGTRIAYSSARKDAPDLYLKAADGSGEEELLLDLNAVHSPSSWSADGRYLMYVHISPGTNFDLSVLPMTGDRKPWVFLNSKFIEASGEFSPDGKWVTYESDESGKREVFVRPFVAPGVGGATQASRSGKWQVSNGGGSYPKWNPNGSEVFFINLAGEMMAAPITIKGSALTSATPVKLFDAHILGGGIDVQGPQYDVARDGRFLINTVADAGAAEIAPIILIQNWNPDVKN